jgi:hypothetical protein
MSNPEYMRQWYEKNKEAHKKRAAADKRRRVQERRKTVRELKEVPCMDCGVQYPYYVMDFDHRDPSQKEFGIHDAMQSSQRAFLAEVAKCDVVCSNCHRERTHGPQVIVDDTSA